LDRDVVRIVQCFVRAGALASERVLAETLWAKRVASVTHTHTGG
jgi:hypothetical protein